MGGKKEIVELDPPDVVDYQLGEIVVDSDNNDRKTLLIGKDQYWDFTTEAFGNR